MYLIDTNILILAFLGRQPAADFFEESFVNGDIVLSPIVIAEFYSKTDTKDERKLDALIQSVRIISLDAVIAKEAGLYRSKFAVKKKQVWLLDCFLAATAKVYDLTLVTHDSKNFPMKDIKVFDPFSQTK